MFQVICLTKKNIKKSIEKWLSIVDGELGICYFVCSTSPKVHEKKLDIIFSTSDSENMNSNVQT